MFNRDFYGYSIEGHIKIWYPESGEIAINKRNAIHYENMSIAMAESLANSGQGFIYEMAFGNGGTSVDPTGIITYLTPNSVGTNAALYNETYSKVVDDRAVTNSDPTRNKIECGSGTTTGNFYYTDCCGNFQQGNSIGVIVSLNYGLSYNGITLLNQPASTTCPTPTPTQTPTFTPTVSPTPTNSPTPTRTPFVTPSPTNTPSNSPVYKPKNECELCSNFRCFRD